MKLFICLAALLLVPELACAGLLTPPPTDKSVELLGYIFGSHIGSVYLGGAANPALMRMFELFNTALITIGGIIVSYVGIVSTINTAQEGQVMGKKWSSIWIPLRSALGMLIMAPTPASGYSIIQTTIIWLIIQGVGAADSIWNGIMGDLGTGLSAARAIQAPKRGAQPGELNAPIYTALENAGAKLTADVLQSAVCMAAIRSIGDRSARMSGGYRAADDSNAVRYGRFIKAYTVNTNSAANDQEAVYSGTINIGIPGNNEYYAVCGKFDITARVKKSDMDHLEAQGTAITKDLLQLKAREIYNYKVLAIQLLFSNTNLGPLADQIVRETVLPRSLNGRLALDAPKKFTPEGYKSKGITAYMQILGSLVKPQEIAEVQDVIREGVLNGWVSAGSFYFALNKIENLNYFEDITNPPVSDNIPKCIDPNYCQQYTPADADVLTPKLRNFLATDQERNFVASRLWDAHVYLETDVAGIAEVLNIGQDQANDPLENLQAEMTEYLMQLMNEQNVDPLIAQGRFGAELMLATEQAWLEQQADLREAINRAAPNAPINQGLQQMLNQLSLAGSLSLTIYGVIWVIGATLAIYVPLIPYMIFTVGVVGWFLLVIEAVIAAPVLSLAIILPGGEELGKIAQGAMLLLNIMLRPVLMLFGFILSIRLYQAMVQLVNFGMLGNFTHLNTQESLFAWIAIICVYAGFVVILANKCFSLIYAVPDKILRWMGGAPEHTDASQELHHVKGTLGKGADTINKISTGYAERNFARLQARVNQLNPPDNIQGGPNAGN